MTDRPLASVLADFGFVTPSERAAALAALEAARLTRPGKHAISVAKLLRVQELLAKRFALSCSACSGAVRRARPNAELLVVADERCENCGGSDHRAAALRFLTACEGSKVHRVLIVGGSPTSQQAVTRLLARLEVKPVDGMGRMTATNAQQLRGWSDLVLVWGKTRLAHRVSDHFTSAKDPKVVAAATSGIAALLDAGTKRIARNRLDTRLGH